MSKNSEKPEKKFKKYPALNKYQNNWKMRKDVIDFDYLDELSDEELQWLNDFMVEYVSGHFKKDKEGKHFHKTKKERKTCTDRNNSRNRDILTRSNAKNLTVQFQSEMVDKYQDPFLHEDYSIALTDYKRKISSKQKQKRQKRQVKRT